MPLAPSFDTVGWLVRSGALAVVVGSVLLDGFRAQTSPPSRLLVLDDVFGRSNASGLVEAAEALAARLGATVTHTDIATGDDLDRWREAFRVLQGAEAWATHGTWIRETDPPMGAAVRARFKAAARITIDDVTAAARDRDELQARLASLLTGGVALVVPATAGAPLPVDADAELVEQSRQATLTITALASLAGAPAVAIPLPTAGLPVGLSLIGAGGEDESLLAAL